MTDTEKTEAPDVAALRARWEQDAPLMVMAAMGRAETDLQTDPFSAMVLATTPLTRQHLDIVRMAMMSVASQLREIFHECGWMTDTPPTDPLPDLVRQHGEESSAAWRKAGLIAEDLAL